MSDLPTVQFTIYRGEDKAWIMKFRDRATKALLNLDTAVTDIEVRVAPKTGAAPIFTKNFAAGVTPLTQLAPTLGQARLDIASADTLSLTPENIGTHQVDVFTISGAVRNAAIKVSPFIILQVASNV